MQVVGRKNVLDPLFRHNIQLITSITTITLSIIDPESLSMMHRVSTRINSHLSSSNSCKCWRLETMLTGSLCKIAEHLLCVGQCGLFIIEHDA